MVQQAQNVSSRSDLRYRESSRLIGNDARTVFHQQDNAGNRWLIVVVQAVAVYIDPCATEDHLVANERALSNHDLRLRRFRGDGEPATA